VRRGVAVVSGSKVAVEGGDDGVGLSLGHVCALPLTDAGPTAVRQSGVSGSFLHQGVGVGVGVVIGDQGDWLGLSKKGRSSVVDQRGWSLSI
jgi:hypothetical protein